MKKRLIAAAIGIVLGVFIYAIAHKESNFTPGQYQGSYMCWGTLDTNKGSQGVGLCLISSIRNFEYEPFDSKSPTNQRRLYILDLAFQGSGTPVWIIWKVFYLEVIWDK
jgi:hypothetical protein